MVKGVKFLSRLLKASCSDVITFPLFFSLPPKPPPPHFLKDPSGALLLALHKSTYYLMRRTLKMVKQEFIITFQQIYSDFWREHIQLTENVLQLRGRKKCHQTQFESIFKDSTNAQLKTVCPFIWKNSATMLQ